MCQILQPWPLLCDDQFCSTECSKLPLLYLWTKQRLVPVCSGVGFRLLLNLSSTLLFINLEASKPSAKTASLLKPGDTSAHPQFKNIMKRFCKLSDKGKMDRSKMLATQNIPANIWHKSFLSCKGHSSATLPFFLVCRRQRYCHHPVFPCSEIFLRHEQIRVSLFPLLQLWHYKTL